MKLRSTVCRTMGVLLLVLCGLPGCGGEPMDTGPAEEPNVGPGFPAGGPPAVAKGDAKAGPHSSAKDVRK